MEEGQKGPSAGGHEQDIEIEQLMDDPELQRLHADRIAQLQREAERRAELSRKGHGEYLEITEVRPGGPGPRALRLPGPRAPSSTAGAALPVTSSSGPASPPLSLGSQGAPGSSGAARAAAVPCCWAPLAPAAPAPGAGAWPGCARAAAQPWPRARMGWGRGACSGAPGRRCLLAALPGLRRSGPPSADRGAGLQGDFLEVVTKGERVVCHFFHKDFERCKIVDRHLQASAGRRMGR
jgi:hypothetical protein